MNNLFFSLSQQLRKINMQIICICSIVGCSLASLYYLYYIFNNDLKFEDFWGFLYLLADIILVVALVLIAVFIGLKKQSVFFLIPFLLLILQELICLFIFVINNIYLGNIYSILYVLCTIFMHLVFVGACIVTIIFIFINKSLAQKKTYIIPMCIWIIYPIVETFRFIIIAIMPYTNLNLLSILYYLISYVIAAAIILALIYLEIKPYEPPVQNGFIQKNGPMPYNGQVPYQNQGPMPYQGPMPNQGQMPYQGPMNNQGQVPNQGPYPNNGQVPPQNQGYNQGQAPNQAQGSDQNLNNNQPNG